jgi:hypothetical protein
LIRLTPQAHDNLRPGEALVFDWHRVAICCACAGEVSLHRDRRARLDASPAYRSLPADPPAPVYAHRHAAVHLAGRDVAVDCRRLLGLRHFESDLPPDFGLRASLGRLPQPSDQGRAS